MSMSIAAFRNLQKKSKRKIKDPRPWDTRYKSAEEEEFARLGVTLLGYDFSGAPTSLRYEPFTLRLASGRYTPDFVLNVGCDLVAIVEVKGSKKQKGYDRTRVKLHEAANTYPEFRFVEARREDGQWVIEEI